MVFTCLTNQIVELGLDVPGKLPSWSSALPGFFYQGVPGVFGYIVFSTLFNTITFE